MKASLICMDNQSFFFSNHQLPIENLPKVNNIDFQLIQSNYWKVIFIQSLLFYSFVLVAVNIIAYLNDAPILFYVLFHICVLAFASTNIFVMRKAFHRKAFAIREHDIVYKKGLLGTTIVTMPYKAVQHVKLSQGILSKKWKLTTIILYGAGGQQQQLAIAGIDENEAYQIKEFILSKINNKQVFVTNEINEEHGDA